ncbi:hypothetical protein MtrunA17_Chr4g0018111 [Medicago truncatula]|uniref:Uncharacterized protein n=1 Tax=Medicago truncatula TaxID=3880 RepID=A0A396I6C5_MEDTR|nr:hypothetical protein MtrunA17_Chr4g0018111 [Medicago truncatula]
MKTKAISVEQPEKQSCNTYYNPIRARTTAKNRRVGLLSNMEVGGAEGSRCSSHHHKRRLHLKMYWIPGGGGEFCVERWQRKETLKVRVFEDPSTPTFFQGKYGDGVPAHNPTIKLVNDLGDNVFRVRVSIPEPMPLS